MAEFTPITTQEQLDALIGDRIKRERETVAKRYADHDELRQKVADYEKQIGELTASAQESAKKYAGYDKTVAELQNKVKGYETASAKTRIAHETGIPFELAHRLSGETEDDIRKDAEVMARFVGQTTRKPTPMASTEPAGVGNSNDAAFRNMLQKMKGE